MLRTIMLAGFWALAINPADAAWREATTANFRVYSESSAKELTDYAARLEKLHAAMVMFLGAKGAASPLKLQVVMLPSSSRVQSFMRNPQKNVYGFYTVRLRGAMAFATRETSASIFGLDGEVAVMHEYAHHFMYQYFTAAYPAWYREGFAEYWPASQSPVAIALPGSMAAPVDAADQRPV
jgi:hypothetical protein